ncbi:Putative C-5 cytosine methyltransferase, Helicase superfamily 1/2, ATP-binding protein [Septoria linicola]|uniref:C-5 cytosine methyltransferase, Helicase superfamily 1/2, ATP-binding protein n=1 Tax=Septoria linicola TaxID=215465 RepID=A0A9Q9AWE9_9PEZI|nr:Putative C-5 cytosine methyltransferase, Helicase superfamily 1/2, ATP-binding protein [Septoria linicola]
MAGSKRKAAKVIDLRSDSEGDENRVASPKKRKVTDSEAIVLASDDENESNVSKANAGQSHRDPFRELTSAEYQRKLRDPKAWVKQDAVEWRSKQRKNSKSRRARLAPSPARAASRATFRRSGSIQDYFTKSTAANASPRAGTARAASTSKVSGATSIFTKARRQPRNAFSLIMQQKSSDASEDELIQPTRKKRKSRSAPESNTKSKRRDDSDDDDDFEPANESSSAGEDESAKPSSDESGFEDASDDDAPSHVATKKQPVKGNSKSEQKATRHNMAKLATLPKGIAKPLDLTLPPIVEPIEIFEDIVSKAMKKGFQDVLSHLSGHLRVATMCSGTESPLLALELISNCLGPSELTIEHLFSAEIVPYKQAYIDRNFSPPVIFRDITELTSVVEEEEPMATTAYGGKALVPRDVDLLVAGTSCVDYSSLNNKGKTMDDGGESGDTYKAVLAYCKAFRPAIVVLENVLNADWDRMLGDYKAIGYESTGALVDTKLWYLPQTRQRGYMVCFDAHNTKAALTGAGPKWTKLMEYFRRPASSPASSSLLPNDMVIARRQMKHGEAITESDWTKCELRHARSRHELRLGNERPVTHWTESGTLIVPEIGNSSWYTGQVERVWDMIDIVVLRKALPEMGFYDARYKSRIWDVSQNVDRETDRNAFGISGCITPSGQFFLSDAGRVLSAEELLKMQGLPLNKISFTTETSSQIQDLAGNAMSTPVVGCAIVAALMAGHTAIKPNPARTAYQIMADSDKFVAAGLKPVEDFHTVHNIDVHALLSKARQASRLCVCEGSRDVTSSALQQCVDCGHTSCVLCGGSPVHNYQQKPMLSNGRLPPTDFEDYLRKVLPLRVHFSPQDAWNGLDLPMEFEQSIEGLGGHFSVQTIRRTQHWTVTYAGSSGQIDLVFLHNQLEWRVFAHPARHLPANSSLRSQLRQPVAIGIAHHTFLGDKWRIRQPQVIKTPLVIKTRGSKASWWQRCGLVDFSNHTIPEYLNIKISSTDTAQLSGQYQYLPHCGTASDSLFKQVGNDPQGPIYLFLDPTAVGEPDKDCFVFARNMERLEHDEVRPILARIAAPWRPWSRPGIHPVKPVLRLDDVWKDVEKGCTLTMPALEIQLTRFDEGDQIFSSASCSQIVHLLRATIPWDEHNYTREGNIAASDAKFFATHHWVLSAIGRCFPKEVWHPYEIAPVHVCERCAPSRPALRWALQASSEVKPYEDPAGATLYEQAMKSRPEAIVVKATKHSGQLSLDLGLNMATLAHRAGARLPRELASDHQYHWRLRQTIDRTPFVFKKFQLVSNKADQPYTADPKLSVTLFDQQKQSLNWMVNQENGVEFVLEQTEEAHVTPLGWMADVRAQATISVRGGICADHPGFGKTITSLALINAQSNQRTKDEIVSELEARKPAGLLATAATLIVCPTSLQQQWAEEIRDKAGLRDGIITIANTGQLSNHSIEAFREAKIIIVNRTVLDAEAYTDRLASFAAIPGPAATTGRAFSQWRKRAIEQVPEHLAVLQQGKAELKKLVSRKYQANLKSDDFEAYVPSRRHRGQDYIANKAKKVAVSKLAAPAVIDTTSIDRPLFEMFYFNRLIVDEFHNAEPQRYAAIVSIQADKRWGLSGTPAIDDLYEVSQVARLLGIELPLGSPDRAVTKPKSIKALKADLTKAELFDMGSRQLPSQERYADIYAQHQRFLNKFVRQNVGDFSAIPYAETLVPVGLEVEQRLLYTELSQHLNTLQMRIKKSGKSKTTDRSKRFNQAVASSTSAEAALSKAAAFCDQVSQLKGRTLLDDLIMSCTDNIEALRAQIVTVACQAMGTDSAKFDTWKTTRLSQNFLRDEAATKEVATLLGNVVAKKAAKSKTSKSAEEKDEGATSKLHSLCPTGKRTRRFKSQSV